MEDRARSLIRDAPAGPAQVLDNVVEINRNDLEVICHRGRKRTVLSLHDLFKGREQSTKFLHRNWVTWFVLHFIARH